MKTQEKDVDKIDKIIEEAEKEIANGDIVGPFNTAQEAIDYLGKADLGGYIDVTQHNKELHFSLIIPPKTRAWYDYLGKGRCPSCNAEALFDTIK